MFSWSEWTVDPIWRRHFPRDQSSTLTDISQTRDVVSLNLSSDLIDLDMGFGHWFDQLNEIDSLDNRSILFAVETIDQHLRASFQSHRRWADPEQSVRKDTDAVPEQILATGMHALYRVFSLVTTYWFPKINILLFLHCTWRWSSDSWISSDEMLFETSTKVDLILYSFSPRIVFSIQWLMEIWCTGYLCLVCM